MQRLLIAILLASLSGAVMAGVPACDRSLLPLNYHTQPKDFSGELPIPDYLDAIVACNTAPPGFAYPLPPQTAANVPSAWLQTERSLYVQVLAKHPADVLVVPFQVQGYALDRIERALMTADLDYAIGRSGKYSVADPWLVAQALGEGMRRVERAAAQSLAQKIGARTIVYGYVGHDTHHKLTLTLEIEQLEANGGFASFPKKWHHDWRSVGFTDEQMPVFKFHELLPEITRALPLGIVLEPGKPSAARPPGPTGINMTPRELVSRANSVPPVVAFDLLGAVNPAIGQLSRERLFERATIAAMNSGESDSAAKFFASYALFNLGRRPPALSLLNGHKSPQAVTLRALLNGDLKGAEQTIARVPDALERVLLQLSLRDLEVAYERKQRIKPAAGKAVFAGASNAWEPLIAARSQSADPWQSNEPVLFKLMLDQAFPEPSLDAKSIVSGAATARGQFVDDVAMDLANVRHVRRAVAHLQPSVCCTPETLRPTEFDLLWLLQGFVEERISSSLQRMVSMQDLSESALENLTRYEPLLSGHPALEAIRAAASIDIGQKSPDDIRKTWIEKGFSSAAVAACWSPGQNSVSRAGLVAMGVYSEQSRLMLDAYGHDYPNQAFWPEFLLEPSNGEQRTAFALEALAFSSSDVTPLQHLAPGKQPGQADTVLASLGERFSGNPAKPEPSLPAAADGVPDPQQVITKLRKAIAADPEPWLNYYSLGLQIVQSGGKFADASQAFLSFPGFHERSPDDPVEISNLAFEWGSLFYWDGMSEFAKPLYKISADLQTGSGGSITSRARLQLFDGNYAAAAATFREAAIRYSSPYDYRDYLSLLHALGYHDEAWKAFSQLHSAFIPPHVWLSALVGQRMQGMKDSELRDWLMQPDIRDAHYRNQQFAPRYAVLWSLTDRKAPPDLAAIVQQLEGKLRGQIDTDGRTLMVPHPQAADGFMVVRPSPFGAGKAPNLPPDTRIKSDLVYFADAYVALQAGDYANAAAKFSAMAERYPIEGYPLSYFAYAAAKSGDKEQLEKYLDSYNATAIRNFDYWLAKAFFAGSRKDAAAAYDALQKALRQHIWYDNEERPALSEYQYAQACEWLYRETADKRFVTELLNWVKRYELMAPSQGWAYAMEYSYEKPGQARTRALAMARYLDSASARIQDASSAELKAADAWFHTNNPFRLPASESVQRRTAWQHASDTPIG